jgi:hypothetical protein
MMMWGNMWTLIAAPLSLPQVMPSLFFESGHCL